MSGGRRLRPSCDCQGLRPTCPLEGAGLFRRQPSRNCAVTRRCSPRGPGGPGSIRAQVQAPVADAWIAALGYISGLSEPISWGAALPTPCDQQPQPGAALLLNREELFGAGARTSLRL